MEPGSIFGVMGHFATNFASKTVHVVSISSVGVQLISKTDSGAVRSILPPLSWIFRDKFTEKTADFSGNYLWKFSVQISLKKISRRPQISWKFSGHILPESD